jgi:hypothetical protein
MTVKRPNRIIHDDEISPWQGDPDNPMAINSASERRSRAQSRKRTQIRRQEHWDETFGPYANAIIVGAIAFMGIVAFALSK